MRPFAAMRGKCLSFSEPGALNRKFSSRSLRHEDRLCSACKSSGIRRSRVRCARFHTPPSPGEPSLFKLHAPRNFIAGGGFFTQFLQWPVRLAWQAFGEGNAALTLKEARERMRPYRGMKIHRLGAFSRLSPFSFRKKNGFPPHRSFQRTRRSARDTNWTCSLGERSGQRQRDWASRFWSPMPAIAEA